MWRIWRLLDPVRVLVAQAIFLTVLGLLIHFILLSTTTLNWLDGAGAKARTVLEKQGTVVQPAAKP
jgi:light-harvesting complex 1 alpha chain